MRQRLRGGDAGLIDRLQARDRGHVSGVFDIDPRKRHDAAARYGVDPELAGPEEMIGLEDVEAVLVLTSMNEHGRSARVALEAGTHVLFESRWATSLDEAAALLELSSSGAVPWRTQSRRRGPIRCDPFRGRAGSPEGADL